MRYKFIVLFLLIGFVSKAQVYQLMPQYGYNTYRMNFDSTIQIPTFCGVPKLGSNITKKGALAFDSCNNRFYYFNPKFQSWDTIKSADVSLFVKYTDTALLLQPYLRKNDTIFLSQRIDQRVKYSDTSGMLLPYLRAIDTTNKWVSSVTKLNDSTIRVIKDGTTTDISISSVTSATRLITQVWNNTGATILRGSVVYISGRHSSNLPTIALAEGNNEANSYKTFALVDGDIGDNSSGFVIQAGKIGGLNLPTSSYTDGDILYLSPTVPGGYTTTKPLAPNHIVKLGSVTRAHPTQGSIEIKIENGWQLDELSDVQIAAVPLDSTILQYSRIDSLWHDVSPLTAMGNRFVKSTDSAAMLQPYLRKIDTASISNRINLKLNISDTSSMLNPYLRKIDTTNKYVTSVFRKTASDSVFFVRGGNNNFAFRDSLGGGSPANPTASVGLTAVNGSANTFMRSDAAPALSQSIAPTWTGTHTFSSGSGVGMFIADGNAIRGTGSGSGTNMYIDGNGGLGGIIHIRSNTLNVRGAYTSTNTINCGQFTSTSNNNTALVTGSGVTSFRIGNTGSGATWFFENHRNAASGSLEISNSTSTPTLTLFPSRNVSIGSNTEIASSRLNVESTTQGFLQPRMTTAQMNAISTPATGLSVFNTTDSAVYIRRGTGAGWQQQAGQISATATLDFPNTLTQTSSDLTISLTGAVDGDAVVLGVPNAAVNANSCYTAWVSASGVVTVRFNNYSSAAIDPAQATFKVTIIK